jgi:molybdopterin biosynthesis enzyme MoaB
MRFVMCNKVLQSVHSEVGTGGLGNIREDTVEDTIEDTIEDTMEGTIEDTMEDTIEDIIEAVVTRPIMAICAAVIAVTHPSTNHSQRPLTTAIGRELTFPEWHGLWRSMGQLFRFDVSYV